MGCDKFTLTVTSVGILKNTCMHINQDPEQQGLQESDGYANYLQGN